LMKAYRRIRCVLLVVGLMCLACLTGTAQVLTGQLSGTVADQSGAVIPAASVTLKNQLTGDIRKTVSNSEGVFAFAAVPTGEYTITIAAQGFAKWERGGIKVSAGDRRIVSDISLGTTAVTVTTDIVANSDV